MKLTTWEYMLFLCEYTVGFDIANCRNFFCLLNNHFESSSNC